MKRADLHDLKLSVAFADLDSLATLVSAIDGHNSVAERNQYAAQAHAILIRVLGDYAKAIYGNEDEPAAAEDTSYIVDGLSPLERFRLEQALKSEDVMYLNTHQQDRRHEVGAFARVLHEVKALLKKVSHEVKALCKKVSVA